MKDDETYMNLPPLSLADPLDKEPLTLDQWLSEPLKTMKDDVLPPTTPQSGHQTKEPVSYIQKALKLDRVAPQDIIGLWCSVCEEIVQFEDTKLVGSANVLIHSSCSYEVSQFVPVEYRDVTRGLVRDMDALVGVMDVILDYVKRKNMGQLQDMVQLRLFVTRFNQFKTDNEFNTEFNTQNVDVDDVIEGLRTAEVPLKVVPLTPVPPRTPVVTTTNVLSPNSTKIDNDLLFYHGFLEQWYNLYGDEPQLSRHVLADMKNTRERFPLRSFFVKAMEEWKNEKLKQTDVLNSVTVGNFLKHVRALSFPDISLDLSDKEFQGSKYWVVKKKKKKN